MKAELKLSGFLSALLICSAIAALLTLYLASLNDAYTPAGYNSTALQEYNKLTELNADVNATWETARGGKDPSGGADIIGVNIGFLSAAKTALNSVSTFTSLSVSAMEHNRLGQAFLIVLSAGIGIVLVGLAFALISMIMKWDT